MPDPTSNEPRPAPSAERDDDDPRRACARSLLEEARQGRPVPRRFRRAAGAILRHVPSPHSNRFIEMCRVYQLHPIVGGFVFTSDQMLGAMEISSMFLLTIVSCVFAALMIVPITLIQGNAYKQQGWGTAFGIACICALVTALPTGLPGLATGAWTIGSWIANRDRHDDDANDNRPHYGSN